MSPSIRTDVISNTKQRYLFKLPPSHKLPLLCTGTGFYHVLYAPGQPANFSGMCNGLCHLSERQKGYAIFPHVHTSNDAHGNHHQPRFSPYMSRGNQLEGAYFLQCHGFPHGVRSNRSNMAVPVVCSRTNVGKLNLMRWNMV